MKKRLLRYLLFILPTFAWSQSANTPPVFPECASTDGATLQNCFFDQVQQKLYDSFKVPSGFDGKAIINIVFEVNVEGNFKLQFVDAPTPELATETRRVFAAFPKVEPPKHNGTPTYSKYTFKLALPLQTPEETRSAQTVGATPIVYDQRLKRQNEAAQIVKNRDRELKELDSISFKKFTDPKFDSHLNIPFSHSYYAHFDAEMNQVGANNHTGSKPYTYAEVSKYYDLRAQNLSLIMDKKTLLGRKLWNENTVQIEGKDYWFTLNPIFDLQRGKTWGDDVDFTYINTRGLNIQGGLGEQINFTTTIYESQGRFAGYFNRLSESLAPSGGNPATIPGIGIAKGFKTTAYDFPLAEATVNFVPSKTFNLQLGYARNFIGDGYRSLITTDGVSPYPFFKLNTTFWKIKYTNTYMFLKDTRPAVTVDGTYAKKFMANHYLSWNATKRLNIGFFESVVWSNENDRGFDASFVNPIIFYRSVEFASSSKTGNALLGLTAKYKLNNQFLAYGQFLLDEFSLNEVKAGNQSWKNKYAYQVGIKYFNALNIKNLLLQAEYNSVRPYTYAHSNPLTNYGHNIQSLGHQWGGNLRELVVIGRYHVGRYFADAKVNLGTRGLDFDPAFDTANYGSNIYRDYDEQRPFDTGVKIGQGNKSKVFIADVQAGYLVNPATNLKLYASLIYRDFNPLQDTVVYKKEQTTWFSLGLRCDIFNWYFDY